MERKILFKPLIDNIKEKGLDYYYEGFPSRIIMIGDNNKEYHAESEIPHDYLILSLQKLINLKTANLVDKVVLPLEMYIHDNIMKIEIWWNEEMNLLLFFHPPPFVTHSSKSVYIDNPDFSKIGKDIAKLYNLKPTEERDYDYFEKWQNGETPTCKWGIKDSSLSQIRIITAFEFDPVILKISFQDYLNAIIDYYEELEAIIDTKDDKLRLKEIQNLLKDIN